MGQVGTEATLQDILGVAKNIKSFTEIIAKGETTETWRGFQTLLDDGLAETMCPPGTQLVDKWEKAAGTSYDTPWDIVHYEDDGGSAFLKWHYSTPDGIPFDEPEAIYFAPSGGLPAGTYHILIGASYGTGWSTAKAIQFTLAAAMDAGDQLVINCGTNYANDPTNGRAWNVYAKGSTTSKQSGTTSNGTDGTSLGTIGATNAHKPEGNLNAISRVVYGYARWSQSAMRQWLNSQAAAGAWWTPQNDWDRPPSVAATLRGFMAGISHEMYAVMQKSQIVTALNTQEGFTTDRETTEDYFFLPSLEQMYINPQLAGVEGDSWDYYKELAEEIGLPGMFQQYGTYPILITYNCSNTTSPVYVWLRSCNRGSAYYEWHVYISGNVGGNYAFSAFRSCPACKISKSAPVIQ